MKMPIDREAFSEFVEQSGIFATAQKYMEQCLKSWYMDEPEHLLMICGQTLRRS